MGKETKSKNLTIKKTRNLTPEAVKKEPEDDKTKVKVEKVEVLDFVIKQEVLTDDEYDFQFVIEDADYFKIVDDLRLKDDDIIKIEEVLQCPREGCKKTFKKKVSLRCHLYNHDVTSFCHLCGIMVKGHLRHHLKNHDKKTEMKGKCDMCGQGFKKMSYLRNHMKTHKHGENLECSWCFKKLKTLENLKIHLQGHVSVKEFVCDLCGREISNIELYNKHLKAHQTNKKFRCNTCFMTFSHQSTLCRHSRIHSQTFTCQFCDEKFSYDSHLRRHFIEEHNDINAIKMLRQVPRNINYRDRRRERRKKSSKNQESGSSSSEESNNDKPKIIVEVTNMYNS